MDLSAATVATLRAALDRRETSAVELVSAYFDRIESLDGRIHAYLTRTRDVALLQARQADAALLGGRGSGLTGIPMALKDILSTRGIATTCASRILEGYVPRYSATVVDRLFEAGAVLLGKTNMDEFAMGSSTENSAFGPTRNPWDLRCVPGGSSGGSAAAVAAGLAPFALGTDTGGSIRQPAALTGTVGLKPTYGRVSRHGLVAFASSLDQVGPITRTVEDAALVLETIAGWDPLDSTSVPEPVPAYAQLLNKGIKGLRLGVPKEYFEGDMHRGVRGSVEHAIDTFRNLGAAITSVSLPHTEFALSTYYIISPAEAMANLARYDGVRYGLSIPGDDVFAMFAHTREQGFGAEVKRRILLGSYALSAGYYDAYYRKAQQVRTLVRQDFDHAFSQVDLLVAPTAPTPAFKLGEKIDDPLAMYLSDVYTVPANIAGICALSMPCGFADDLPVGVQLIGPAFSEASVLNAGHAFQQATDFHYAIPDSGFAAMTS